MSTTEFSVFYEATPNPQSMKFVVTSPFTNESANFNDVASTLRSPLARKIFGFPWAAGVFIGPNFVTVTKQDWVEWEILADPLAELIKEHLERREPVYSASPTGDETRGADEDDPADSSTVQVIKRIIRDEIRPAVAMDGGDILFNRFEEGRVYLHMQGACSGCPSSAYTLKEGIETRLKQAVPEVVEVIAV